MVFAILGFVPDEGLLMLYSGSNLFVLPSLYDGVGLRLAEAMYGGATVVASNAASMPEVVGDAAFLIQSTHPEAFAEAILGARSEDNLRRTKIEKGLS